MLWTAWEFITDIFSEGLYSGVRFQRSLVNLLNWRLIRALGELQLLTRASYIMLILVPIFAATWPAVRLVVNQHNTAVMEAQRVLDQTAQSVDKTLLNAQKELQAIASEEDNKKILLSTFDRLEQATKETLASVSQYTDDYARRTLDSPRFPWSFAAAFFAALFVVSGHLIYQLLAPETVRAMTWDAFILARKEEYSKHPSEDALTRAREFIGTRSGQRLEEHERSEDERVLERLFNERENRETLTHSLRSLEAPRLKSLARWIRAGSSQAPPDYQRDVLEIIEPLLGPSSLDDSIQTMTTIERGARAEYLFLASRNFAGILLTGVLYLLGVVVLCGIIRVQVLAVVAAAGWESVFQLIAP